VGWYAATVFLGLVIHATVTLPLILFLVARVRPHRHVHAMAPALLTAFSTASSGGTLPITIECAEKRAGVSNRVTSFVLPLGATVNMDGTALYECVAAIFIAQIYVTQGVIDPLTFGQQFLVVVTALAASIGAAAIPHAGLVMMAVILKAIGLPFEAVGYIWAVDRFLDMCRTSVNVWSDSCGTVVIARSEGETGILEAGSSGSGEDRPAATGDAPST
jgi:Na+/H+-dicarboxylate symporter